MVIYFRRLAVCGALLVLLPYLSQAQSKQLDYSISAAGVSSAGSSPGVPFWLAANRRGRMDRVSHSLFSRISAVIPTDASQRFDYSAGVQLLGRASEHNTFTAQELFGSVRYRSLRMTAGRKAHVTGIIDTSLSLGSMLWSRNAPAIPKVSASSDGFVAIPGTDGWVHAKGYLSHGWMEPGRYVNEAYLHEKYLYLQLAPDRWPVHGYAGIVHSAIWGGISPARGPQRDSFSDYVQMFAGSRPDSDNEAEALGNTVAMYDFGLEWEGTVEGLLYREFYIEDKPGLWFRSPWDGLWGLSLRFGRDGRGSTPLVERILYEHVNTRRQGSRYDLGEPQGADNYYNHSVYLSGWTYQGRTIGMPLMYSHDGRMGVINNRLVAHHFGLQGHLAEALRYRAFLTYSRNYGARSVVVRGSDGDVGRVSGRWARRDTVSGYFVVFGPVPGELPLSFRVGLALDRGEALGDRMGILVGLSYSGSVGLNR